MNSQLTSHILDQLQAKTARTISFDVEHQIKEKYRTFTRFNYRDTLREMRQSKKKKENNNNKIEIGELLASFFMSTMGEVKNQDKPESKKKKIIVEELAGIKSERRQRFKKAANSLQIVKHYIEKEGFKPNEEEMYLMTSLAGLREFSEQNTLDSILKSKN